MTWPVTLRVRPPAFEPLSGHELAIVSVDALRLLDETLSLAQLLGRLAERNVAGVVVVGAVDAAAVERANRSSLPLLRLPDTYYFADLGPTISRVIAEQKTKQYQLGLDVHHQLAEVSMSGRGLGAIVARVSDLTSRPVVLLDDTGGVLVRAGDVSFADVVPPIDLLIQRCQPVSGGRGEPAAVHVVRDAGTALISPVVVRDSVVGYLILLAATDDFGDEDHIAVTRGSLVCALELAKQEAVTEAERRLRGDFFDALLNGAPGESMEALVDRGQRLGYDLQRTYLALAIAPDEPDHGESGDAATARIAREVSEYLASRRAVGFVASRRQAVALFLSVNLGTGVSPGSDTPPARVRDVEANDHRGESRPAEPGFHRPGDLSGARRFAEELRDYLSGPVGLSVSIGLGRYHAGLGGLRIGWREAEQASQIGREFFGPGQITAYGDLGVYRLLYAFRDSEELASFCDDTLAALLEYDEKNSTELLQTLDVFFRCDAGLRAAADALFLHRNSMAYRLRRISEISGLDLDNLEDRFRLQLALKGYRLLRGKRLLSPDRVSTAL